MIMARLLQIKDQATPPAGEQSASAYCSWTIRPLFTKKQALSPVLASGVY